MNNMDRCKVICHMMTSIDGKIDGSYMDEKDNEPIGDFYDKQIWEMGNANGSGSLTAKMYFADNEIDYSKYKNVDVSKYSPISYKISRVVMLDNGGVQLIYDKSDF